MDPPPPVANTDRVALVPPDKETLPKIVLPDDGPEPSVAPARLKPTVAEVIRTINASLEDAFFLYDRSELTSDALTALARDAQLLSAMLTDFPRVKIIVEGHCDERGSAEYNLALGDRRAHHAAGILTQKGVPESNLQILSYGKELPACDQPTDSCWQRNRRVHLSVSQE
jgi:peptidoglycan-associated lipoprotein